MKMTKYKNTHNVKKRQQVEEAKKPEKVTFIYPKYKEITNESTSKDIILPDKGDIVYFSHREFLNNQALPCLSSFVNYMNLIYKKKTLNFSYASKDGSLIKNISLINNMLLEVETNPFVKIDENYLYNILIKKENDPLLLLYRRIKKPMSRPSSISKEVYKLTSLIRAIIKDSDILFLDSPEEHLSQKAIALLKNAIYVEAKRNKKIVFIKTDKQPIWYSIMNKTLIKNEMNKYFMQLIEIESKKEEKGESYNVLNISDKKAA
jgi:ABC-type sugar transport system ATPase subunit